MDRRRFLALCGGSFTGIWLAGTGLVALDRQMVLRLIGACSFCGKRAGEVFGLAGLASRDVRVCDECIGLCFEIIAEQSHPGSKWTDPDDFDALVDRYGAEGDRARIEAELGAMVERRVIRGELACSFCDRTQSEVAKLIAGPKVYICDGCIGDAGGILLNKRLRT